MYGPQQQPPPYGPPTQPHGVPPAPKPFSRNVQHFMIGAGVLAFVALAVVVATSGGGSDDSSTAPSSPQISTATVAPPYTIVNEQRRTITVEVNSTKDLPAVFDAVRSGKRRPDGGYFVMINCSTGGTKTVDNRLANGKFALGKLGAAQTGLQAGKSELEINSDRVCPDNQ